MIKLKDLVLAEGQFMWGYQTHNGKYSVKATKMRPGLSGTIELTVIDRERGTKKKLKFDTPREAKAFWKKLHKGNLKSRDENIEEGRFDGADFLFHSVTPMGRFTIKVYQMDSKMGGAVEVVVYDKKKHKETVYTFEDEYKAKDFARKLNKTDPR